ncbi:3-ketoacyl-CoA thiolase [Purpureocillium lavendulum]|uniref:3-ketoacyl-CoA thiolase n=1 Tax=Purpureocillium lavendulum TaxID=1247861 RepID=A0AB34FM74_9HYPO|nr:3-ketoacyl-CoA thiolase [Purpureocillium lavendulum]
MPAVVPLENANRIVGGHADSRPAIQAPLTYAGGLDGFDAADVTPVIGREITGLQIRDLLKAESSSLIRDVAVTVSQRGVLFLKNQDVTPSEMKDFMLKLTSLSGCPSSSGLHVHPLTEEGSELGDQISVISSEKQKKGGGLTHQLSDVSRFASAGWHSDITFERVPSDYAMLKIHTLPPSGGDTLWASGYEVYDRLSAPMKTFLEGLTATHDASFFHDEAARLGNPLRQGERGSPLNKGGNLTAVHPLIRTNPVTGWKSVYVNKGFTKRINGVTKDESDVLLQYLFNLVTQNHDVQVRYRWSKNDVAIWDNRSTFHCRDLEHAETPPLERIAHLLEILDIYASRLYPIWPIVNTNELKEALLATSANSSASRLAHAIALATVAQLKLSTAWRGSPAACALDDGGDESNPLDNLRVSFFLHIYYENLEGGGRKSLLSLREAITLAQIERLEHESTYSSWDEQDQQLYRRVLWLLFVTERGVALLHKLPAILKPNILLPWYGVADDVAHILPDFLKLDSTKGDSWGPGNDIQRADMLVTRQWMRAVLWRAALRFGIIIPSISPVDIAREFLSLISVIPAAALESHGPTVEFKTFEIATAVIDAMASDFCGISDDQSRQVLHGLRSILMSSRGGNEKLLQLLNVRMSAITTSSLLPQPYNVERFVEDVLLSMGEDGTWKSLHLMPSPPAEGHLSAEPGSQDIGMPRKGTAKVRTGCKTCKARRVKCDEQRPTCLRCHKAGKICRGYDPPPIGHYSWEELLFRNKLVRPGPSTLPDATIDELRLCAYYGAVVAPSVNGPVLHTFWTGFVNQVLHNEPAARHAIVAIGSLFESSSAALRNGQIAAAPSDANKHALMHYNTAIRHLMSPKVSMTHDAVLLVCILFICIEFLRYNGRAAATHALHAVSLLNSFGHAREEVLCALLHLGTVPYHFGTGAASSFELPLQIDQTRCPRIFSGPCQPQAWLDSLSIQTVRLVRLAKECRAGASHVIPLQKIKEATVVLDRDLDTWWSAFQDTEHATRDELAIMRKFQEAQFLHAKMRISTDLDHNEYIWATQEAAFRRFITVCQEARGALSNGYGGGRAFVFGMGFSELLFRTVHKCRVLKLRLEALALMDDLCWARETAWDRTLLKALGKKIIEVEHGVELTRKSIDTLREVGAGEVVGPLVRDFVLSPEPEPSANSDGSTTWRRRVTLIRMDPEGKSVGMFDDYVEIRPGDLVEE